MRSATSRPTSRGSRILARNADAVFHLSAVFGGREFVDTRQADCSKMLSIDHNVIDASFEAGVERFHFASSACVYPDSLQKNPKYLLKESDILSTGEGWKSSDNLYGFAKLMGELQCVVFHKEKGMKTSACRYLTVYGPGEYDTSHAISALIEKALDRMNPYVVWGSGCLPPGGLVFAGGHYEEISKIKIGDRVEDHRGNFQLVLNKFKRDYCGNMYTIKGMGLKPFELTSSHLVMVVKLGTFCNVGRPHFCKPDCFCMNYEVYHKHGHSKTDPKVSVQWRRADSLRPTVQSGEYLIFPKLKIQAEPAVIRLKDFMTKKSNFRRELYNDIEVDSDFAFFLGWYTAEGWTCWNKSNRGNRPKGTVQVALGPGERDIGLKLVKIARDRGFSPYIRTRKPNNPKYKTIFEMGFSGTGFAKWLDVNVGKGARKKRVPAIIFHASEEVIRSYLKGLFMGDGNKSRYVERLTSTSAQLLLDVQVLLSALSRFGCVVLPKETQSWGILEWSNEKYNKFWQDDESIYTPITFVNASSYKGQVYDIETADHTFAAPVLVHNSQQRGFTFVTDIVNGSILACEKIEDGTGVNLGWDKRYSIKEVAQMMLKITGLKSKMVFDKTKPEGPFSRALNISLAKNLLQWQPKVDLFEGLERTIAWHKTLRVGQGAGKKP